MKLRGKTLECEIEKLVNGGFGLARHDKVLFVYNALPGEQVQAWVYKDKRNHAEAVATEILHPSPHRLAPQEDHFLSCSPWQILDFSQENHWKQVITQEVFQTVGGITLEERPIVAEELRFHYRNKMEFSFIESEGQVSLAFFKRGQHRKQPIPGCVLAHPAINEIALRLVESLNRHGISASHLKAVILRSNRAGEVIAGLFVTDSEFPELAEIQPDGTLKGFSIYYSNPQSPASIITKVLYASGQDYLLETVNGKPFHYHLMSFFQVNVDLFEKAVTAMQPYVSEEEVLDYYCGVGSIGIALSDSVKRCHMVDISEDSIGNAHDNIQLNNLSHYTAMCGKAEKLLEAIEPEKLMIVDPPRSGMHPKVLKTLLKQRPKRIVYLSCNIATCARDVQALLAHYRMVFQETYNFFPATPHIEFLTVLDRL